jgi:peptidyl-prolyl cis-trans isomerase B (cyclophilin B)
MKKLFFFTVAGVVLFAFTATKSLAQTEENAQEAEVSEEVVVLLETTMGNIKLKLYNETARHRDNFVKLVESGYYDGLLFHRVINNFMIQGGDPDSKNAEAGVLLGEGGPDYTIPSEIYPQFMHKKGSLAAAREADPINPTRASSGSQFYIVQGQAYTDEAMEKMISEKGIQLNARQRQVYATTGGTPWLDNKYTIFGETIEGFDVIDKIAIVKTDENDRPEEDVKIIKATILKK